MERTVNLSQEVADRELALVVYQNKIYEGDNHQFALEKAMKDYGKSLGIDLENDIDTAAKLTYQLSEKNDIQAFDVFNDGKHRYLVSHFEENLKTCKQLLQDYANTNNLIIGTFKDFDSDICYIGGKDYVK